MKKVVLLLTAVLFAGVSANTANALTDGKEAANEGNIVVNIDTAAKNKVEVIDINTLSAEEVSQLNEGNLLYQKGKILQSLDNFDKKIKAAAAKNDEAAVARLNEEKNKVFEKLEEIDNKILEEGGDEELKQARAKAAEISEENNLHSQKMELVDAIMDLDKKIEANKKHAEEVTKLEPEPADLLASKEEKVDPVLAAQKDDLLKKLDDINAKIAAAEAKTSDKK